MFFFASHCIYTTSLETLMEVSLIGRILFCKFCFARVLCTLLRSIDRRVRIDPSCTSLDETKSSFYNYKMCRYVLMKSIANTYAYIKNDMLKGGNVIFLFVLFVDSYSSSTNFTHGKDPQHRDVIFDNIHKIT